MMNLVLDMLNLQCLLNLKMYLGGSSHGAQNTDRIWGLLA